MSGLYGPSGGGSIAAATFTTAGKVLQTVFNVRDYGATGDGTTDDTAAINAAIAAAGAGRTYLPPGTYLVAAPLLLQTDGATLDGVYAADAGGGARIRASASFAGDTILKVQRAANDRPVAGATVRDLVIDGNGKAGYGVDGVRFRSYEGRAENLYVTGCSGNGVAVYDYGGEMQAIAASGAISGGTLTLTFGANTTTALAFNADSVAAAAALNALASVVAAGYVVVEGGPLPTAPMRVLFLASGARALITANSGSLTGGGTVSVSRDTAGRTVWNCYNTVLSKVEITGCGLDGLDLHGTDLHLDHCVVASNGSARPGYPVAAGIRLAGASAQVNQCHAYGNLGPGVLVTGSARNKLNQCKIEGNNGGVYLVDTMVSGTVDFQLQGGSCCSNDLVDHNTHDDVRVDSPTNNREHDAFTITGVNFDDYAGAVRYNTYVVSGHANNFSVTDNMYPSSPTTGRYNFPGTTFGAAIVRNNAGLVTEASGTATIAAAATAVVVTHGLAMTPQAKNISVSLTNLPTTAIGELYVDTITGTQFTIRCRTAPGAATAIVGWQAANI